MPVILQRCRAGCRALARWSIVALILLVGIVELPGATVTWSGNGAGGLWSDGANWGGSAPSTGDSLVFAGSNTSTTNDITGGSFASITFNAGAGNFVLGGNAVTLTGGATAVRSNAVTGTMTINLGVTFATTAPTITSTAGGTLVFSQAVANGGLTVSVAAAGPVTFSAGVTGTGGVTKSGTSTLTFSGLSGTAASNFSGNTMIDAGTITITGTTALTGQLLFGSSNGVTTVGTLDLSGGSLALTGALTARTNSASYNQITIGNGQTLTTAGGLTLGYSTTPAANVLTRLSASGAGTFTITGGAVQVGVSQGTPNDVTRTNDCILDVTGLTGASGFSTTAGLGSFNVGQGASSCGTVLLSNTANTIIATTLRIGDSAGQNGTGSPLMTLGTGTNVIQADTIQIGYSKLNGTLSFASQASGSPGTVTIANRAGSGAAAVTLGRNGGTGTASVFTGLLDLRGHAATVNIGALILGQCDNALTGSTTGTLRFDTGTMTIASITCGVKSGTGGSGDGIGNLEISGGTVSVSGAIATASNSVATGTATSNITFSGGTVMLGGNLTKTGGTSTTSNLTLSGATLNAGSRTIGSAAQNVVFTLQSGALSNLAELNGGGTLTKSTAGTVTLSGTNAWSGTTSIAAGTLLLGSANALPNGTGKGAVSVGSTLDLNGFATAMNGLSGAGTVTSGIAGGVTLTCGSGNATATFTGVVQNGSGTVALTKTGTGVQTLSAVQTYTGATTVGAGSLLVNNALSASSAVSVAGGTLGGTGTVGAVTMGASGTLAPGNGGTATGVLTAASVAGVATAGLSVDLDGTATSAERIVTSGALTLDGTLTVASTSNPAPGLTYTIVSAGTLSGTFTGVADNSLVLTGGRAFVVHYDYGAGTVTLTDQSSVWDGGGGNDLWSTPGNWVGDALPLAGNVLIFTSSPRPTPVNDLAGPFSRVIFPVGAGSVDLQGAVITLTGGSSAITSQTTSGTITISAPLAFTTAAPTITTAAGGALVLSGSSIDTGGMTLTVANTGTAIISGAVTGTGGITKSGSATLTMSGNGTYSGGTLLALGDLQISASGGAVSGPLGTGTLTVNAGVSNARVLLAGGQTIANALTMDTAVPGSGLGVLQQTGSGLATWTGTITANVNTTNGGHVLGGATAADALVLSGTVTLGGSATRFILRSGFVVFSGAAGVMAELGLGGTARLGASNTFPASVQVFSSISATTGQGGTLDLNGFNQTIGGLTLNNAGGGIVTTGAGTLTLAGDLSQTFTGTLDANVNTISGNLDLAGATRTFTISDSSAANDLVVSAVISNGALTKAGTGTLAFTGTSANTYTGATTVSAGTLLLNRTAGVNAVAGDIAITGGRVTFGANHQIADTAAVTMSGTTSVFNGTGVNAGQLAALNETVAALTITGGCYNGGSPGTLSVLTVTGATSVTGGGNTIFLATSGTVFTTASLSLSAMSATAGGTIATNNSFTIYGNSTTSTTLLQIGSGGVSLNNSVINLRRGGAAAFGCRMILDGDLTTSGTANCAITEDTNGGTNGSIGLEWSSTAGAVTRTITASSGTGVLTIGVPISNGASAAVSVTKTGASQTTFSGGANTYTGLTTVSSGLLFLNKASGVSAIGGDLTITGGQVRLAGSNTLPDTCAVTMSGATSVFNGTGVNLNTANITETIASLTMTGGSFSAGGTSQWSITGAWSITGGGTTIYVGNSGSRLTTGSLALHAMTATAGGTVPTGDSFTLYGVSTANQTTLTIGAGGLTLDGSVLNMRRGGAAGQFGSRVILTGNLTTSGSASSTISEDTVGGTFGTVVVELGNAAGAVTRTLTAGSGGADLAILVPISDGLATPGALSKAGTGRLTLGGANTYTGSSAVTAGTLRVTGSIAAASAVSTAASTTLEGTGTINGTVTMTGSALQPGTGSTTLGTLTTGAITLDNVSATTVDLSASDNTSDHLVSTGAVAIDGTLTVASGVSATVDTVYTIVSGSSRSGTFSNAPDGSLIPIAGGSVRIAYLANAVTLTVHPAPSITTVAPGHGPVGIQTPIVIAGGGFVSGATVTIGGLPATGVTVDSPTQISAVTPAGTQGPRDVVVTNPDGRSVTLTGGFIYRGPPPLISGISPGAGLMAGNYPMTVSGSDFADVTVRIGGTVATITAQSATSITVTAPSSLVQGPVDVVVTNVDLLSATQTGGFIYQGPTPTISGVSPNAGVMAGNYPVTISGNNFANATVTIGGTTAAVTAQSSTSITVTAPASLVQGPVDVVVTNVDLLSVTAAGGFTYQGPAPTISAVNPGFGPMAGGTSVTISGTNFAGATVTIGGNNAAVTAQSATSITVTSPASLVQGPADVVVTNVDQLSVTSTGGFIYRGPPPVIATVSPDDGPVAGGTVVTITGSDFAGATVTIGGVTAAVSAQSAASITVTTPTSAMIGPRDVVVTNVDQLSTTLTDGFNYLGPVPTIGGIAPGVVPINYTATPITISGTGFATGVTVTVGGQAATIQSVSSTAVVFTLPTSGLTPGPVTVVLTNVDFQSASFVGFIVQGPAPILTGIDVPFGPVTGNRRMTITGSAFRSGAIVTLDGLPATDVVVVNANTITAVTPAHAKGAVTVTVTNDDFLAGSLVNAYSYYEHDDEHTTGNGCGTGGGLAVLILVAFAFLAQAPRGYRRLGS